MPKVQNVSKYKYIIHYLTTAICEISSCFLRLLSPFTFNSWTCSANKHFKAGINRDRIEKSFLDA